MCFSLQGLYVLGHTLRWKMKCLRYTAVSAACGQLDGYLCSGILNQQSKLIELLCRKMTGRLKSLFINQLTDQWILTVSDQWDLTALLSLQKLTKNFMRSAWFLQFRNSQPITFLNKQDDTNESEVACYCFALISLFV